MNPSERQLKVLEEWENTENNILVNSVAGSGKTTLLMMLMGIHKERSRYLVFNKSVQEEADKKLESKGHKHCRASTIHSLGMKFIKKYFGSVTVKSNRAYSLIDEVFEDLIKDYKEGVLFEYESEINKTILSRKFEDKFSFKMSVKNAWDISRQNYVTDIEMISDIAAKQDRIVEPSKFLSEVIKRIREVYLEGLKAERPVIDFLDMIFLPVHLKMDLREGVKYMYIDEAQDLNQIQHMFINKYITQNEVNKFVAVGDPKQAIYGFAGALTDSFYKFLDIEQTVELPLDVCYRCSTSVIDEANKVFSNMSYGIDETGSVLDVGGSVEHITNNSMILCRNASPLLDVYFRLIKLNKNPTLLSKGELVSNLKGYLKKHSRRRLSDLNQIFQKRYDDLAQDAESKIPFKIAKFKRFTESFNMFKVLFDHFEVSCVTGEDLLEKLEDINSKSKKDSIILSTIHKSKGLEAENVYFLNRDLIPSKFSKSDEQLEQEKNLVYVARTRAQKNLYYLTIE